MKGFGEARDELDSLVLVRSLVLKRAPPRAAGAGPSSVRSRHRQRALRMRRRQNQDRRVRERRSRAGASDRHAAEDGRPVQFEILEPARTTILAWLERRCGGIDDFAFPSRIDHAAHISTRQYARLVDEWVIRIGFHAKDYGTHSLRRTKASIIYKRTGNLRAVQILLGHTKIESTVYYLGVDVEDALTLAEGTEL